MDKRCRKRCLLRAKSAAHWLACALLPLANCAKLGQDAALAELMRNSKAPTGRKFEMGGVMMCRACFLCVVGVSSHRVDWINNGAL